MLQELLHIWKEIHSIESSAALLQWDQATYLPERGARLRGRQLATLRSVAHHRLCSTDIGVLLRRLQSVADEQTREGAMVRRLTRRYERARALPDTFVHELEEHLARSYAAWTKVRAEKNAHERKQGFKTLQPILERSVTLSRRKAEYMAGRSNYAHIADPLIEEHDEGMSAADITALFSSLREGLGSLVRRAAAAPSEDHLPTGPYATDQQLAFGKGVIDALGFDTSRGRQDLSPHPFMVRIGGGDVRMTTRVREDDLLEALFSTIHETGHALYEQGIDPDLDGTPLGTGVSTGVHESQSRLFENFVGRSKPFWTHFFPKLRDCFAALASWETERFVEAINQVRPTPIRTSADELTYNLHIMLRFDLELALLEDKLKVAELPELWNARMQEDLGINVQDDHEGVLQDIHWFAAPIGGHFQGYTLGNAIAAQLMESIEEEYPDLWPQIAGGYFAPLRDWLRENIWWHGATYPPSELVEKATGQPLTAQPLLKYLQRKFGDN